MKKEIPALMRPPEMSEPEKPKKPDGEQEILQRKIEACYAKLAEAWRLRLSKPERIRATLSDVAMEWTQHKDFIREGLRHKETRIRALETVRRVQDMARSLFEKDHHSERHFSKEEQLAIFLNDDVLAELPGLDDEVRESDNPYRELALVVMSEMLDSLDTRQREKAEAWLIEHLPSLEDVMREEIQGFSSYESDTTKVWQNLLLRTEKTESFEKVFEAFRRTWKESGSTEWTGMNRAFFLPIFTTHVKPLAQRKDWIAMGLADMYGLNGPETVEKWSYDGNEYMEEHHGPSYQYCYPDHLSALAYLEQEQPGAARDLQKEFNISHFGRYSLNALLNQWENRDASKPYGVMMYPDADWNGAFFDRSGVMAEAMLKLRAGGYETRIVEADSKFRAAKEMLILEKRYASAGRKMGFFILCGHGKSHKIMMGEPGRTDIDRSYSKEQISRSEFTIEDVKKSLGVGRVFDRLLEPEASTVLFSCSTGAEGGFAQELSKKTGKIVIGPSIPVIIGSLEVGFTPEGKPTLHPGYKTVTGGDAEGARYISGQKQG